MNAFTDINKLHVDVECEDEVFIPQRAHEGDAGYDLKSSVNVVLAPGEFKLIPTGVKLNLPKTTVGMVCPRSGLAAKHAVTVLNAPGIVDNGFTGEINVILINHHSTEAFEINVGDRIAQLVVAKHYDIKFSVKGKLDETDRGAGGFGSSGGFGGKK